MADKQNDTREERQEQGAENGGAEERAPESGEQDLPQLVVGVGASAGGLPAIQQFLSGLEGEEPWAVVVLQHQDPNSPKKLLSGLLSGKGGLPVEEAEDGQRLEAGRVYVCPADKNARVEDGHVRLAGSQSGSATRPIDDLLRSLAENFGHRAVGVVLSGANKDGQLGCQEINRLGGLILAQDPDDADHPTMPASVMDAGVADLVLVPDQMAEHVRSHLRNMARADGGEQGPQPVLDASERGELLRVLRQFTGHDFNQYKTSTIDRRIARRMGITGKDSPEEYLALVREDDKEAGGLLDDLLISVTRFFRDHQAFDALKEHLAERYLPDMERSKFRAWVPGCATGEEAYSVAMVLAEAMEESGRTLDVDIFATDLSAAAVEKARQGVYPPNIEADVSPQRLKRFFVRTEEGNYRINKEIRDQLVFAEHNILHDPPFSNLDLLCCRNLLIYLNNQAQAAVKDAFRYGLRQDGLLLLGTAEGMDTARSKFQEVDKRWRLYRHTEPGGGGKGREGGWSARRSHLPGKEGERKQEEPGKSPQRRGVSEAAREFLLRSCTPPAVLVSRNGDILFLHGRTGRFLEPGQGEPQNNVLEMARPGLKVELTAALSLAASGEKEQRRRSLRVRTNGEEALVDLEVLPTGEVFYDQPSFMVCFRETGEPAGDVAEAAESTDQEQSQKRIAELELELSQLRQDMQTVIEEYEAANEELRSSNEELQSANEELQSTNEELETAKEEMQSINEEQATLNAELQDKNESLTNLREDMDNLLASTQVATLFLDKDLAIKRFTPAVREIMQLRERDLGRPVADMAMDLQYGDLERDARRVLENLNTVTTEARTGEGAWYQVRINPYRTRKDVIDGVVITFNPITRLKQSEVQAREARDYARNVLDTAREPMLVLDADLNVETAAKAFYRAFRLTQDEVVGRKLYHLGKGQWNVPELRELLEEVIPQEQAVEDYRMEADLPRLGRRTMLLNARLVDLEHGGKRILLAIGLEEAQG
jgi:two-component system CheB/CheR fusion protein